MSRSYRRGFRRALGQLRAALRLPSRGPTVRDHGGSRRSRRLSARPGRSGGRTVPRRGGPRRRPTWFAGQPHPTPYFSARICDLATNSPARPSSASRPRPSWSIPAFGRRVGSGRLLTDVRASVKPMPPSTDVDPVQLEIFNNQFAWIAEQMGTTLQHTAITTNVKERLDFSSRFHGRGPPGRQRAAHPGAPGGDGRNGQHIMADIPPRAGRRLCDERSVSRRIAPARRHRRHAGHHAETGRLLFFTASRAHHAEIGGIVPGSMPPFSRCLAEEGVLISNFKLVDRGRSREDELRQLLLAGPYPTRNVEDNLTDIAAQVAANELGARQLRELVDRYSLPVVAAYMEHIQRAAAQKMRSALAAIPDGIYSHTTTSTMDPQLRFDRQKQGRGDRRLHRHGSGPRHEPQRQSGHRDGRRDVRLSLPDRRRHPAQQRRARAGRNRAADLPAQSARRQRP